MLLAEPDEINPPYQTVPCVTNSERVEWLEQAYQLLREELLPEASERITIVFGFPSKGARDSRSNRIGEDRGVPERPEAH